MDARGGQGRRKSLPDRTSSAKEARIERSGGPTADVLPLMEKVPPEIRASGHGSHEDPLTPLIARIARGDETALKALYDATAARVLGIAQQIVRDHARAEEAVVEVFAQVWKQAERYEPVKGSVATWICTLARTRAIDLRRAERRHEMRSARPGDEALEFLPDLAASPLVHAQDSDRAECVQRALDLLPSEQRRCVEAAFFGGLSHTEIAERFGQPLGTVKTRIRTGLSALRRALAPLEGEPA